MRLNVFLWLPRVSPCSHSPHSSIHRHSPTHWHPQGTAQVWGNTESSSITPNHVSTLLPRPISIFFFHLHSSSLDYFHPCPPLYSTSPTFMQLSLSPPTLLPASSFCQLTALNTCHLIHSPNVPLFLLSWTSCVLFLLTNIFWLSLIHILFSPLCCLATVCGPANNSMRDVYILRECVFGRRTVRKRCVSVFMVLGDSGVTAREAEIRLQMSPSTPASLGILLTGGISYCW